MQAGANWQEMDIAATREHIAADGYQGTGTATGMSTATDKNPDLVRTFDWTLVTTGLRPPIDRLLGKGYSTYHASERRESEMSKTGGRRISWEGGVRQ